NVATLRGVPDDPATLASEGAELLWTLNEFGQFLGFEMAGGTIGQRTGVPVAFPGSCPPAVNGGPPTYPSEDGAGLRRCWKDPSLWSDGKPGINYAGTYAAGSAPATRDVTLCVNESAAGFSIDNDCAKVGRKDLFLEIDYMDFHKPDTSAG